MKDKDIDKIIKSMYIIVDSRENLPNKITNYLEDIGVEYDVRKLTSGDYSAIVPPNEELGFKGIDFTDELVIERKMSNDEIIGNLTRGKDRFYREFDRFQGKIIIMIEDTYKNGLEEKHRSKLTKNQYVGLLHSLSISTESPFIFIDRESSAEFIYNTFKYSLKNKLKNIK